MSYEQMQNNQVYLSGQIASAPEFSHEIMGEKFYDTTVSVERLSGQSDVIPITVSDRLMEGQNFEIGNLIGLIGQFRSYNKIVDGKSKLVLRVFVRELCECDENAPNVIELEGYVCKPPVYRTTPFKTRNCRFTYCRKSRIQQIRLYSRNSVGKERALCLDVRRRRQNSSRRPYSVAYISKVA